MRRGRALLWIGAVAAALGLILGRHRSRPTHQTIPSDPSDTGLEAATASHEEQEGSTTYGLLGFATLATVATLVAAYLIVGIPDSLLTLALWVVPATVIPFVVVVQRRGKRASATFTLAAAIVALASIGYANRQAGVPSGDGLDIFEFSAQPLDVSSIAGAPTPSDPLKAIKGPELIVRIESNALSIQCSSCSADKPVVLGFGRFADYGPSFKMSTSPSGESSAKYLGQITSPKPVGEGTFSTNLVRLSGPVTDLDIAVEGGSFATSGTSDVRIVGPIVVPGSEAQTKAMAAAGMGNWYPLLPAPTTWQFFGSGDGPTGYEDVYSVTASRPTPYAADTEFVGWTTESVSPGPSAVLVSAARSRRSDLYTIIASAFLGAVAWPLMQQIASGWAHLRSVSRQERSRKRRAEAK